MFAHIPNLRYNPKIIWFATDDYNFNFNPPITAHTMQRLNAYGIK